jgi:hypothetical protein
MSAVRPRPSQLRYFLFISQKKEKNVRDSNSGLPRDGLPKKMYVAAENRTRHLRNRRVRYHWTIVVNDDWPKVRSIQKKSICQSDPETLLPTKITVSLNRLFSIVALIPLKMQFCNTSTGTLLKS